MASITANRLMALHFHMRYDTLMRKLQPRVPYAVGNYIVNTLS